MKRICFLISFLFVFCINTGLKGENLRWPLDIEISQSSSFAEFRGMKFHGGLDLRTKQTNGFPVYAIEDGFISRASVQFTGYGYGLYIDHPKLNIRVVYGHLQKFNGPIWSYVESKLKSKGIRHGFNEFFKSGKFPVKKGQIVAYSGESGAGPSHLHFEIRTLKDEPIAPAKFGYRPKDNIFPTLYKFYAEPMEYGAVIDDSFLPKTYALTKKNKGFYMLSATPATFGKVGFKIGIADSNGFGNKYGIESIQFLLNKNSLIQRDFYQYSYDTDRQSPWVYDYFKSNMSGTGYVISLFKYPFETLPFAAGYSAWSGVINNNSYSGQKASLEIKALDFGRNAVSIIGTHSKVLYDFSKVVPKSEVDGFILADIVPSYFRTTVVCKNPELFGSNSNKKAANIKSGCVEIRDAMGELHLVPCLVNDRRLELAFKNESCWQGGAWLGNIQLLPKSFYIDAKGGRIAEDGIWVEFQKNTMHFPALAMLRNVNDNPIAGGNDKEGLLKPCSAVWRFDPMELVFDEEAIVTLIPRGFYDDIEKLGVYNVANDGKYSYNGGEADNNCLKFKTRCGGRYVILEDLIPPTLRYARTFVHYQLGKVHVFRASDLGKGVSWLSGSATINDEKVETYADPDRKEVYVIIPPSIKTPHRIKLSVKDWANNTASISTTIAK